MQSPRNRALFLAAEGVDLMIIMLRERKAAQHGALKVLDHALNSDSAESADIARVFVDRLGLKVVALLIVCLAHAPWQYMQHALTQTRP